MSINSLWIGAAGKLMLEDAVSQVEEDMAGQYKHTNIFQYISFTVEILDSDSYRISFFTTVDSEWNSSFWKSFQEKLNQKIQQEYHVLAVISAPQVVKVKAGNDYLYMIVTVDDEDIVQQLMGASR